MPRLLRAKEIEALERERELSQAASPAEPPRERPRGRVRQHSENVVRNRNTGLGLGTRESNTGLGLESNTRLGLGTRARADAVMLSSRSKPALFSKRRLLDASCHRKALETLKPLEPSS